jgi:hypothetical protein
MPPSSHAPKPAAPAAGPQQKKRIKVRATRTGYYDHARRREGDVFVAFEHEFSPAWMERVAPGTPEKTTTGQQELNAKYDAVREDRAGGVDVDVI